MARADRAGHLRQHVVSERGSHAGAYEEMYLGQPAQRVACQVRHWQARARDKGGLKEDTLYDRGDHYLGNNAWASSGDGIAADNWELAGGRPRPAAPALSLV